MTGTWGTVKPITLNGKRLEKYAPLATRRKIGNGLTVTVEGKIFDKSKELPIEKETGDRDTDRMVAISPKVRYRRKNNRWGNYDNKSANIDDLMAEAEFVDGDKSKMKRPRVLHKNMNYLDFHADNLEWVEESSPKYQEYMKRKKEDMDKLEKELNRNNPNFKLPDNQ